MNWLKNLNDAITYIEEHLTDDISLENVSAQAYSSYYHFTRTFYVISGMTLKEYIRNRRLSQAAYDLMSTDSLVIDVAYKYQYQTPESFSKAFKKFHGVNPTDVFKKGTKIRSFNKLSFQINIKGEGIMNYEIKELSNLSFVGFVKTISTEEGQNFIDIPKFWEEVSTDGRFDMLSQHADESGVYGVMYDWNPDENSFSYMIAIKNNGQEILGTKQVTFDDQKFASFEAKGELPQALQTVVKEIFSEWLPSSNFTHSGGPDLEVYPHGDPNHEDYICYYLVPIV